MEIDLGNGRMIGDGHPCFVVGEIGQNHNGDVYLATRLLAVAAAAGVDAAKLCKRHIPSELTRAAYEAPYCSPNSSGPTYGTHREALELTPEQYAHLKDRVRYNGWPLILFSTVCDLQSLCDVQGALNPPLYKIASRDLNNLPLLEAVAETGKPIILSTGMARLGEIETALKLIRRRHDRIVLLVCTSEYPTANEHVGLWRLAEYREQYGVLTGLSDHTPGIVAAQLGAALGACLVEKHFTLARAMRGTDHAASLEPDGLTRLVRNIRIGEAMMDRRYAREIADAVHPARLKLGRSLVAVRPIAAGQRIALDDLCLKSPGDGIPWPEVLRIVGRCAGRDIPADTTLHWPDIVKESHVHVPA